MKSNLSSLPPQWGCIAMGLLRPTHKTRSGFRRASLGTLLLIGGGVAGLLIGMPKLHQSLTAEQAPQELTCVELLQGGIPTDTAVVTLTDAVVHPPGKINTDNLDGENAVTPALGGITKLLADPRAEKLVDRLVRGDVLPRGIPKRGDYQPLKLSLGRQIAELAQEEIGKTGKLTVHVSADPTSRWVSQAAGLLSIELPEKLAKQAEMPAYTLHPASLIGSRRDAMFWVGGGAVAMVLGFILCGSAPLGWWMFVSPIGAVLGLPGIFIRNGRGNFLTWFLGIIVGGASLAGAYHLAVTMGGFGQASGTWWLAAAGLLAGCFGTAAILGTCLSFRNRRRGGLGADQLANLGVDSNSKPRRNAAPQTNEVSKPVQLQSMIAKPEYARRYLDPKLSVSIEMETAEEVSTQTKSLEKLQFDAPLIIEVCAGEHTCTGTVQVGCQNMVMATTDEYEGDMHIRMTSVLEDGHLVVSSDGRDGRLVEPINGDATSVRIYEVTKAAKLVTKHLEEAAKIAEKRKTTLVMLDPSEWRDIIHYSERSLAATLRDAHHEKWDITNAHYGRFNFPPTPVTMPAMV
ncbi:hypothetical protein [Neorhodopirellula lusitana]|uniref:hypothetical protein n=1 Tax=Neorhodopirellula lusitana TaxID=445327 RepID=UPI00384EA2E6